MTLPDHVSLKGLPAPGRRLWTFVRPNWRAPLWEAGPPQPSRAERIRSLPLFLQVLGLVIISLVAAQTITITALFLLPPPPPEDYKLSEIVRTFRTGGPVTAAETTARPLVLEYLNGPPPMSRPGRRWFEFRDAVARSLDVEPDRVVISIDGLRVIRSPHPPLDRGGRPPPLPPPRPDDRADPVIFAPFKVAVRQSDGRWMTVHPANEFRVNSWQGRVLLTLLLSVLAISPLAWLFSRRLAAPIGAFASAADRLGRDPNAAPLEISGSAEVNAAVLAFNEMQERLRKYVEHRTAMVGAIAHDLRTPLTRLRFRIEAAPDDLRGKLAQEVEQMDAMISATLAFVRDATQTGERKKLELMSLVEAVVDETAETGADAMVERADRVVVHGDPIALKRLVENLVQNALKYGGRARARVFAEEGRAIIEIEDNGPGIPPHDLERVFEPFYRGEPSRSRQTGGIGLGLAVVLSIARAHGGDVTLQNGPRGGLTARVALPAGV